MKPQNNSPRIELIFAIIAGVALVGIALYTFIHQLQHPEKSIYDLVADNWRLYLVEFFLIFITACYYGTSEK